MAEKSGLVLRQIVDRNGRRTSRWAKPETRRDSLPEIPAPSLPSESGTAAEDPVTRAIALRGAAHAYVTGINGGEDDFDSDFDYLNDLIEAAEEDLSVLPTPVLNEIARPINCRFATMTALRDAIEQERPVEVMRDILHAVEAISDAGFDTDQFRAYVEDLASYQGIEPFDTDGEYPELRTRQLTALMIVTGEVEKLVQDGIIPFQPTLPSGMATITDPEIVRLTVRHPDRAPQLIAERQTLDTDLLRELLEGETPAVAEGTL